MWKQGILDANVAMELLGKDADAHVTIPQTGETSSKPTDSVVPAKRPASELTNDDPEELDEILEQAKKAKNETYLTNSISFLF